MQKKFFALITLMDRLVCGLFDCVYAYLCLYVYVYVYVCVCVCVYVCVCVCVDILVFKYIHQYWHGKNPQANQRCCHTKRELKNLPKYILIIPSTRIN